MFSAFPMKISNPHFRNPFFILLLPAFFALHGYAEHYPLIGAGEMLVLFLGYLLGSAIFTFVLFIFIRSWRSASILGFLVMCFYLFFGAIHDWFKTWLNNTFLVRYSFLLPAFLLILILSIIYLRKFKPGFPRFSAYLNVLLLILILFDLVQLGFKKNDDRMVNNRSTGFSICDSCDKPDIYFIIADEYAGKKELSDIFRFDNSPFENELRKRGFHITDSSFSNYNLTGYSVASLLNMDYLKEMDGTKITLNAHRLSLRKIDQNSFVGFLQHAGYEVKNYSVFQLAGQLPPEATTLFRSGLKLLTDQTFHSRFRRDIGYDLASKLNLRSEMKRMRSEILHINDGLFSKTWNEAVSESGKPRFVYTHLFIPHNPYYYDRNGRMYPVEELNEDEQYNREKYIEYLLYGNKKYLELIDHILTSSKKPPVIVFMGDHGFREFRNNSVDNKYFFMNFSSIYLPDKNYQQFYKGMSNVNLFRVLLNTEFGQELPLLRDTTFLLR